MRFNRPPDPTEKEIAAKCLEIQAGWSDAERTHRRLMMPSGPRRVRDPLTVQVVSMAAFGLVSSKASEG